MNPLPYTTGTWICRRRMASRRRAPSSGPRPRRNSSTIQNPSGVKEKPGSSAEGRPAVWVLDPRTNTVALRTVELRQHDVARVVVGQGLEPDEIVVTAGVQTLRPGQRVRLLGAAPPS